MNEGRGIGGQIVCLLHHQRLCLPGSEQHLSTNWLRSEEKTQPLEIVKLFYNKNNLNWGHSIVKRFKSNAVPALPWFICKWSSLHGKNPLNDFPAFLPFYLRRLAVSCTGERRARAVDDLEEGRRR